MKSMVLPVLLIVANITGAGMILPQVLRLHRRRVVDGLSGVWVGVGIAINLWWFAYALQGSLWGMIPVSVAGAALYVIIACQFFRIVGPDARCSLAMGASGLGLVPLVFLVAAGWNAAGLALGLCYGVQFLPAAIAAMRSASLDAISATTWLLAWIEAVIWFGYGVAIDDPALLVGGAGGAVMASVIIVRLAQDSLASTSTSLDGSAVERDVREPTRTTLQLS